LTVSLGGYPSTLNVIRHARSGRIGLGHKFPPQFGQTPSSTRATHSAQNVHSNVQIMASVELGGSALLQCSQTGLSSSIRFLHSRRQNATA
jgi:hypothetical protein